MNRLPNLLLSSVMRLLFCLLLGAGLLLDAAVPAHAQYIDADQDLFVGQPVSLSLLEPRDTLIVTYRPGSSIEVVERLPAHGGLRVEWTPSQAGVVRLMTPNGPAQNVSVRFQQTPLSGLFVLMGAGLILFGGIAYAFRKLFSDSGSKTEPLVRPDT